MQQRLVFIPETALRNEEYLVAEFYRFIDHCVLEHGVFSADTVTGPEVEAFCALWYEGEVRNGGHTQFIANGDGHMFIFESALSGLTAVGARPQEEILREMIAWFRSNPDDARRVMSEPFQPEALDRLDHRFFDAQDIQSISAQTADWIAQLPNLRVVSERAFLDLLQNPGSVPPG
jgi:hypothetical protein